MRRNRAMFESSCSSRPPISWMDTNKASTSRRRGTMSRNNIGPSVRTLHIWIRMVAIVTLSSLMKNRMTPGAIHSSPGRAMTDTVLQRLLFLRSWCLCMCEAAPSLDCAHSTCGSMIIPVVDIRGVSKMRMRSEGHTVYQSQ
jgi:hypothetical protein